MNVLQGSPGGPQGHGAPRSSRQSHPSSGSPTAQQVGNPHSPQQSPSWLPSRQSLDDAADQAGRPRRSASLQSHRVSFDKSGASRPGSAQGLQTSQHRMQRQGLRTSSSHHPTDKEIASFKSRRVRDCTCCSAVVCCVQNFLCGVPRKGLGVPAQGGESPLWTTAHAPVALCHNCIRCSEPSYAGTRPTPQCPQLPPWCCL